MLDVKRLRVLREVAAQGSFSAAADSLSYTQSAVSQQIAALEREAGTTLVERRARGVHLTQAGRALVVHADAILARLAAAERELESIAGLDGGHLRIVSLPSAASSLVPVAIAEFRRRYPAVELSLQPGEPDESIACVKSGECDVAVALESSFRPLEDPAISKERLVDDPMFLVMPRDHPLARKRNVRLEDFADEAWIQGTPSQSCPDTAILLRACQAAGFEPQIAFESDDYTAIQGFIAAGVGVALIPDLALMSVREDIVIRDLGPQAPSRRVFAATLSECSRPPATQAMLEILTASAHDYEVGRRRLALAS